MNPADAKVVEVKDFGAAEVNICKCNLEVGGLTSDCDASSRASHNHSSDECDYSLDVSPTLTNDSIQNDAVTTA